MDFMRMPTVTCRGGLMCQFRIATASAISPFSKRLRHLVTDVGVRTSSVKSIMAISCTRSTCRFAPSASFVM
eukprot:3485002-Prorocentrum_lima.AAC.1